MKHRIVITRQRPVLRAALIGGAACALALAAFALYSYVRRTTVSEFQQNKTELEQLRDERRDLGRELRTAKSEINALKERVVYAERSGQIDEQACGEVKTSLDKSQAEAADLREQIAFYRGIVSPADSRAGVRVLELRISPAATAGLWRYDLVLIQSVRNDKRVIGGIQIGLVGQQAGKLLSMQIKDLMAAESGTWTFSFKYFQEFGGEFRLPTGFRPQRVTVTLSPQGEGAPRVDEDFEWTKVTAVTAAKGKLP